MRRLMRVVRRRSSDPDRVLVWAMVTLAFVVSLPDGLARLVDVALLATVYGVGTEVIKRFVTRPVASVLQLNAAVAMVAVLAVTTDGSWPTAPNLLYLPLIAYAAARSTRSGILVGISAGLAFVIPVTAGATLSTTLAQRWLAMVAVAVWDPLESTCRHASLSIL